ncbi:MAG: hypothetical protein PHS14_10505, partial [Elusimicrobia bacterium]|nr:hypothetical protein [Elusimicrobiota bacterium]
WRDGHANELRAIISDERKRREPRCVCDPKHSATSTQCLACFPAPDPRDALLSQAREVLGTMLTNVPWYHRGPVELAIDAIDDWKERA